MTEKLSAPAYSLSLDGKSLTLKVPFSYSTEDADGNVTVVDNKESYGSKSYACSAAAAEKVLG